MVVNGTLKIWGRMKLTKRDIPYVIVAAILLYSFSVVTLYLAIWLLSLIVNVPEVSRVAMFSTAAILTTVAYFTKNNK